MDLSEMVKVFFEYPLGSSTICSIPLLWSRLLPLGPFKAGVPCKFISKKQDCRFSTAKEKFNKDLSGLSVCQSVCAISGIPLHLHSILCIQSKDCISFEKDLTPI